MAVSSVELDVDVGSSNVELTDTDPPEGFSVVELDSALVSAPVALVAALDVEPADVSVVETLSVVDSPIVVDALALANSVSPCEQDAKVVMTTRETMVFLMMASGSLGG